MIRALALCALVAALLAGIATAAPSPADLESQLVCPVCGTTLDQSDAPIAQRMKRYIRQRLAAGASEKEIKAELVDQFGPAVLAEPPKSGFDLLAWLVPAVRARGLPSATSIRTCWRSAASALSSATSPRP